MRKTACMGILKIAKHSFRLGDALKRTTMLLLRDRSTDGWMNGNISCIVLWSFRAMDKASKENAFAELRKYRPIPLKQNARRGPPRVPRAAAWGWHHYPFSIKILILGVFCDVICLTTPFWAYIGYYDQSATFGLWHHCSDGQCTSIHDNLVAGKDVPGSSVLSILRSIRNLCL